MPAKCQISRCYIAALWYFGHGRKYPVFPFLDIGSSGLWLLNGGQVVAVALVAALKQPLAAGVMGLLLFGQIALQPALSPVGGPALHRDGNPARIVRRTWPWLLAAMVVAAWAMP